VDVKKIVAVMSSDRRLVPDPVDRETLIFTPESMKTEKKVTALKKLLQQMLQ
jgi:hypothetical protein